MKDTEYTFAVARIRACETGLMNSTELNSVLASKSYDDAVKRLREKGYDINGADFSGATDKKLVDAWTLLETILPDIRQMDTVLIKNDFKNLKVCLKALVSGKSTDGLFSYPSKYPPEMIKELVFERRNDELPEELRHCDRSAYNILTKTRFAQLGDSVIDRAALEWAIKYSEKADNAIMRRLAQTEAALADIKTVYRCILSKKAESFMLRAVCDCEWFTKQEIISAAASTQDLFDFIRHTPFEKGTKALEQGTAAFEKYADDAVTDLLRVGKSEPFGISALVGYWYAVKTEVLNLRIILSGKQTGQSDETIRERMRNTYV